jgi:hypothetical protein
MNPRVLALPLLLALSACNQTTTPVAAPASPASGVTAASFQMPAGAGCTGEVSRFRAVMDNDLATGHVARSVHGRVVAEIDGAGAACAAGRDAEAQRMVASIKARYGYR